MDSLQAAVLLVKLRYLEQWNATRRKHAQQYDELLSDIAEITTPPIVEYATPVYALYTIRARDRDHLQVFLRERGVVTGVYYPIPLHLQPAYQSLGYKEHDFPVAETAAREVLSLPMYPELHADEITRITESIRDYYR
jgi:dTDP-4-amino-4,6-dideoxygalactose transaminase